MDAADWIKDRIYVPILAVLIFLLLVILFIVLITCCRRRRLRFRPRNYAAFEAVPHEGTLAQRQEAERKSAYENYVLYLKNHLNYSLKEHLPQQGSCESKHWFLVEVKNETDHMLTIVPYNSNMHLKFDRRTCQTMTALFSLIKHPFIFPITTVDFVLEKRFVVVIQPFSVRGSLRDYMYQPCFKDSRSNKYTGFKLMQVQLFGRQVLEALLFLEAMGFPAHGSVHSGNIMFEDGVCRLAGYENVFLGNTSHLLPVIQEKLKGDNKHAVDVLSFGHLLFEMAFGSELVTAHPDLQHLVRAQPPEIVEILRFIFENPSGKYPSLKEVCAHLFFAKTKLIEMERFNPSIELTKVMKDLLAAMHMSRKHEYIVPMTTAASP